MIGLGYIPERDPAAATKEQLLALAEMVAQDVAFEVGGPVPKEVRHRGWIAPRYTRNQGPRPSCVGHGKSSGGFVLNTIDCKAKGVEFKDGPPAMAAYFSWRKAQERCGLRGETGATISGASKAAKLDGFCLELSCRYEDARIDADDVREASEHTLLGQTTNLKGDPDAVRQYLGTGTGVVVIGIKWTAGLAGCRATKGFVQGLGGAVYGYHCVLITGYFEFNGELWFEVLNSHGVAFGDEGFFYIRARDVRTLMTDPNSEWHGWTDLREYGPVRDLAWAKGFDPLPRMPEFRVGRKWNWRMAP